MSGNRSKSACFEVGWITLSADFRGKGASPTNHSLYQSNRVIPLSCGIKMSAVRHLVLSQCTRVTDGQTDGRTDRITTPKTALAYARAVKSNRRQSGLKCDRFAAVFCASLTPYNSAITSTNRSEIPTTPNGYPYMTAAIYWCLGGRKFDDGTTVRTLNCVGNGHWSYSSVHCDCTYVI